MKHDPYWLTARFESKCTCGATIRKGERAFYFPNGRVIKCAKPECGEKASAEFQAAAMDEAFMSGNTY